MALSIKEGAVELDWEPTSIGEHDAPMSVITGKQIRGKTIFKNDLLVLIALVNQHQQVTEYDQWRSMMNAHWERGVQRLTEISNGQRDWIRILDSI